MPHETGSSLLQRHEDGHDEYQGQDGKQQAARRANGERKPESFLLSVYEERHQAQNGGKRGQEHRNNLVVVSLDVQIHTRQRLRLAGRRLVVVLVDDVNTGIHHQSAQQDQRGETARPELHSGKVERQERADEGHRNQSDDDERQPERLEKYGTHEVDNQHND